MILVDTNVLVALGNKSDQLHKAANELLDSLDDEDLVVVPMVVAETCYLIGERDRGGPAAEALFLRDVANGSFILAEMTNDDVERMADLVEQYASANIGGTDASIVAIAERMGIDTIATFNRRDFDIVRHKNGNAFNVIP